MAENKVSPNPDFLSDDLDAVLEKYSFQELLGAYWGIAYSEGQTGVSRGTEAQMVLSALTALFEAKTVQITVE